MIVWLLLTLNLHDDLFDIYAKMLLLLLLSYVFLSLIIACSDLFLAFSPICRERYVLVL